MKTEALKPTKTDMEAIQALTLTELAEEDVFIFGAQFIDDEPTANGRIWSVEWQRANVENFIGIPVVVNHENDQRLVLGRVFSAEQKTNAITGKVYVPITTTVGKEAKAKIEAGLFRSVSINARANNTKTEGDNKRILPGDDDRVFELSFVATGGCLDCHVSTEIAETDSGLMEFATQALQETQSEFLRNARFALGDIQKETYEKVAETLAPLLLKQVSADLRRAYEAGQEKEIPAQAENDTTETINQGFEKIRAIRGG